MDNAAQQLNAGLRATKMMFILIACRRLSCFAGPTPHACLPRNL